MISLVALISPSVPDAAIPTPSEVNSVLPASNVPAISVLPDEDATLNLFVAISKSPSIPVAPETFKDPVISVVLELPVS